MNLPAQLFPHDSLWLGNLLFFIVLVQALKHAQWRDLFSNEIRTNALIALMFATPIFWHLNAGIRPGFNFHLIGSTLFLLIFGWPVALLALTLIMLGTWLYMGMDLTSLGINGLTMLVVPMLSTEALLRFSQRHLPKNFFIFVLLNGFFSAGMATVMMIIATTMLLLGFTHYTWPEIQYHYFIPAPIITFAEAFATGAFITAFTVSQPEAVKNFNVADYLTGK